MKQTWCVRFEAKHRYIKRLASFIAYFKNVAYTVPIAYLLTYSTRMKRVWYEKHTRMIRDRYAYDTRTKFHLKKYIAVNFNNHFHAYEVITGEEPSTFITRNELFIHTPMHLPRAIRTAGKNAPSFVVIPYSTTIHA